MSRENLLQIDGKDAKVASADIDFNMWFLEFLDRKA
jgi:hypothetical protein